MDGDATLPAENLDPPPVRLFERLRQIAGYTWDESQPISHSTYDNWHVFGSKNKPSSSVSTSPTSTHHDFHSPPESRRPTSEYGSESTYSQGGSVESLSQDVIARISTHTLREERAFYICKNLTRFGDPDGNHIARPIDAVRLNPVPGDKSPLIVCIYEYAGNNCLPKYIDHGPAWYRVRMIGDRHETFVGDHYNDEPMPVETFLDFAVGATECLELLHNGQRIVHGEIRGDAFHLDIETRAVKLINFGSGLRTFEHGLTSTGWSALSKEIGAKTKLSFMSPEQTGRMPVEPDSRTDIYSLGILFWTLLTQQAAFDGETPMDIIQGVLSKRLRLVSSFRLNVPDVISRIIQKMTARAITERYHSASGLRYDLIEVRRLLSLGDSESLANWRIATNDVSSFFILPDIMVGRTEEHDRVVKVIDKVARKHLMNQIQDINGISSESALSEGRLESFVATSALLSELSSEGDNTSSGETRSISLGPRTLFSGDPRPYKSGTSQIRSGPTSMNNSMEGQDISANSTQSLTNFKLREKNPVLDSKSVAGSANSDIPGTRSSTSDGVGGLNSHRNAQKFRRKGRCEVISISGAAGLGKSCLVQSVQVEARRRGYFASSKFDQAKTTPFAPVLKLLSSLFKQVFSESDTNTPFHQILKQHIKPVWPMLHKILQLPEFLLGPLHTPSKPTHSSQLSQSYNKRLRSDYSRRESPPTSSPSSVYSVSLGTQSSQDFLRAGASTKSVRLMNTFLEVLRLFAQHKFICFCLDDLQIADDESLDLITQILSSGIRMVLILTYRADVELPKRIKDIIEPPNSEEYIKSPGLGITRIVLDPISEDDIVQYVAETLCRPKQEIIPLAAVIQSKTAGSPFYIREMLNTCHRKQCIWYDYRENGWCYDIDRIFKHFATKSYHEILDGEFVTSRLGELPPTTRSILAWGSLIGTTFSFELVQRLLSGEFDYQEEDGSRVAGQLCCLSHTSSNSAVENLQPAIQNYIIIQTQDDDRFRFAHDRYVHAARTLCGCFIPKMHFIIAQTLLKYYAAEDQLWDAIAIHICASVDIINERVMYKQAFREVLFDYAQSAAESGARPTAIKCYAHCFALLQSDPWTDGPDVSYEETLELYTRAAECYLYMGQFEETNRLLETVIENAKTPVDRAPAWVLRSRMYVQERDSDSAFHMLKVCLRALDVNVDANPTFHDCDVEFEQVSQQLQTIDLSELIARQMPIDSNLSIVGAVLIEAVSSSFWTCQLTFYQMTLVMMNTFITRGNFPQADQAFTYFAMVAITRFNRIKFAAELGNTRLALSERWHDGLSLPRSESIFYLSVGHIQTPIEHALPRVEAALEVAIQSGDRIWTILSFGLVGMLKLFTSEHLVDLEAFCTYGCEEIPHWEHDIRGGPMVIAVRQVSKAFQGKTFFSNASHILSDQRHNSQVYKAWLNNASGNSRPPLIFYECLEIAPLFLYGFYESAIDLGNSNLKVIDTVWSCTATRFLMFFHGLSLAGLMWRKLQDPVRSVYQANPTPESEKLESDLRDEVSSVAKLIRYFCRKIEDWQTVSNVNYFAWSKLLAAQVSEMEEDHGAALMCYEESLDHASAHSFVFEEALGNYLLAGLFLRVGSRRPAKATLREAVMLYRQFGAVGVAKHIEDEHSFLLQGPMKNPRTADAGVQTDFVVDSAHVPYQSLEGDLRQVRVRSISETKDDRIGAWQGGSARPTTGGGLPTLDMLDLTSILESSQVISSVLQVDQLLKTMCEIILQNCGGLATMAAIIVEDEDPVGWSIAASGDPENGVVAHIPSLPLNETALVAVNAILYCTRFRESVFLPNIIHDERFSNVSEAWSARHRDGKSVIGIPICHGDKPLLGVLYLEGEPNAFTDRNLTVLQLLVNQIGISYSNALTLKEVEKVSAFNNSMVDVQKKALAKALEAEKQANNAKAEALRNVKLAEEATKAKSIFLANVSHELRTPLNGVIGNSELLRDSELRKDQASMADSIRVSAELLLTVINDILDFSKMEADKMKLFIVAFNPDEMIREVVRSVSYSHRDKKSSKNVDIVQDIRLPQALIFGDPVRLHQVLGNLIGNSLKFTENGSITVGARTDEETHDSVKLTFWVKDTGIGIPKQQLAKLFTPFSQADASTARKYGGSGLGLSICKSLIESMMGGKIQLESTENQGTTAWFTVTFPKANSETTAGDSQDKAALKEPATKLESGEQETGISAFSYGNFSNLPRDQIRICIAEDNPINQKIAIQFMNKLGFGDVDAYDNGLAAVEGLRSNAREGKPYHIILMDVQMPVLDGYEATKLIRKDPIDAVRGVLVIAMTASAIQGDRERCIASGMDDYLAKPVRSTVLKKKLDRYLQQPLTPNLQQSARNIAGEMTTGSNGAMSPPIFDSSNPTSPVDRTKTHHDGFGFDGKGLERITE